MIIITMSFLVLALMGAYALFFVAPRSGTGYRFGVPFRLAKSSPRIWQKSNRFAGLSLFLSSLFLAVPPFIWGRGAAVQVFLLLVWGAALLPLLGLSVYAYTLLLFLKEENTD